METKQKRQMIIAVIRSLGGLELRGADNWRLLVSCLDALQRVADDMQADERRGGHDEETSHDLREGRS